MSRRAVLLLAVVLAAAPATASAAPRRDAAYYILPPGDYGGLPLTAHSRDQLPLYDGLTPLRGNVTAAAIRSHFLLEDFAPVGTSTVEETGHPGLRIVRDGYGIPHVYGRTRAATWWGAGWVAGEDRGLLLALGRNAARAAVADVPGINAFSLVTSGRSFTPSARSEALVRSEAAQIVRAYGAKGRRILRDLDDYAAGVTAYMRHSGSTAPAFTRYDAIAVTAFIGSIFGNGGGAEAQNADFLARLRAQLGAGRGSRAFEDLMEADDPDTYTTTRRRFGYGRDGGFPTAGSKLIDAGSYRGVTAGQPRLASNFLVVGASRSATGEPMAVMGPQLGYFYPEIVLQADLHGPGIHAQGSMVPGGGPYILIGRTRDYAWSLTSATNDNRDEFLEKLCDPDGSAPTRASTHYVYKGRCRAMTRFDAGLLGASGSEPARELTFDMTVHGPVVGTATIGGRPYAIARKRSTYGQDGVSLGALHDMTLGRATTPRRFWRIADEFGFTFNWAYVSRRHVAYFSSGLLPRRAPGLNRLLPTVGSGAYDWRGWLPALAHPHDVDPRGGLFLNWNNKPAHGWIGGDDDHAWGSVHRVEMFDRFPRRVRLRDVVSIMNRAATEDLRATRVWPVVRAVLGRSAAPNPMTARAVALLDSWSRRGASRLDRDLDGKVDDPGAAIVDAAFPRIAKAVVGGQLGALTDQLATLQTIDGEPNPGGSSFGGGWYGYVDKDLRALLGRPLRSRFNLRYCGRGSLSACRSALWSALADATQELSAAKGPNPSAWRADATAERIRFQPGLISDTMRWTNRPTFQQVLRFAHPPARRHPRLTG